MDLTPPQTRVLIDTLEIDATISQEHVAEADVTEHPVEEGADPADHVRVRAATLTLNCVQSSTPLQETAPVLVRDQDRNITGGGVGFGLTTRVKQADAYLLNAVNSGRLMSITTSLRKYSNMVLTSYRAQRDAKTGDCLAFSASFKQVRLVANLLETPTDDLRGKGKKSLGKKPATPTKKERPQTILHEWLVAPFEGPGEDG